MRASPDNPKPVRCGLIGVGNRGTALLRILLDLPAVEVPALCDIDGTALAGAQEICQKKGRPLPAGYGRGESGYARLLDRSDLDAVIIATPWELHARISIAAMKAGKYAGTEVPAALTTEDCWDLVKTSEQTGVPCMMLENVNYFRNVLLVQNMIRLGIFGEVIHCEGGYRHDVRRLKFDRSGNLSWRGTHAAARNGNLYPTHPIGPIARWMNINRGDRFTRLVSMSTVSRGMNHYAERKFGQGHPAATRRFVEGDVNTTLIQTAKGYTITLGYEMQTPRPYDLGFRVQGTKGIYSGTLDKIYLEGADPDAAESWSDMQPFYQKYEHPVWKDSLAIAGRYGHGGGDYFVLREFVEAVRNRTRTPIDVYDTATWSVILPLSVQSVARGGAPAEFPDFTSGRWSDVPK